MQKGKFIYQTKIKEYKQNGLNIDFGIYGIFDTKKVKWNYFIISYVTDPQGNMKLTEDICGRTTSASYDTIEAYGRCEVYRRIQMQVGNRFERDHTRDARQKDWRNIRRRIKKEALSLFFNIY